MRLLAVARCGSQKEPPPGISGTPTESNIMYWQAVIFGPEDTPWEGGAWEACGAAARPHRPARWGAVRAPTSPAGLRRSAWGPRAGTFKLTLTFTEDYPNKAPTVRFESKMFHPNSACAAPPPSRPFFDCVAPVARARPQSTPTAASAWTSCRTTGAPSTTCRRCSPPSSRCSATPTQTRQPTPRRRACTPSAGACAAAPRSAAVAHCAPPRRREYNKRVQARRGGALLLVRV